MVTMATVMSLACLAGALWMMYLKSHRNLTVEEAWLLGLLAGSGVVIGVMLLIWSVEAR